MTRRKQEGPLEGAFLLAHPCCTFTPASRCTIAPALTQLPLSFDTHYFRNKKALLGLDFFQSLARSHRRWPLVFHAEILQH